MKDNYRSKFVSVVIQPKMESTEFWLSNLTDREINDKLIEVSFPTPDQMPEAFNKIRVLTVNAQNKKPVTQWAYGTETSEVSKIPHYQIYLEFDVLVRLSSVYEELDKFFEGKAHIVTKKVYTNQFEEYCLKEQIATNGNVFKSLQFALYFLAIKMGLIPLSLPFELNQDQPNQQLLSRVNKVESPGYYPYLSLYNDYRPSGLLMDSIERSSSVPQYSYSQNAINELRAGSSRVREAAWLLITIWMLQQQSVGFQPVRPVARPPHVEAAQNLLFGKPKPDQFSSQRVETKLESRKRHRAEIQIDMGHQYEQFLLTKNRNTNCSRQRFEELCRDQKTGRIDFSSIDEALGLLEAEGRGFVEGGYRTEKDVIDADFGIKGPHPYDLADVKTPINWSRGNEDLEAAAERMGKKIKQQRSRMQNYGKTPLHIVDLRKLNTSEKTDFKQNVIDAIGISKDLVFVNDEVKS